jgi:hypothetical protein
MNANISLALATKIDMILSANYGSDSGKFLSFVPPGQPMSFDFDELILTTDGEKDTDVQTIDSNKYNFAYLANVIPEDKVVFEDKNGLLLWDQFKSIIDNSITANMNSSTEDQMLLAEKRIFLENNYATYRNYKIPFDQATDNFLNAKISLDCSAGEDKVKLQNDWDNFQKEMLEERIKSTLNDLIFLGKKNEIEACMQSISKITTATGINDLRNEIAQALDSLVVSENDLGLPYFPTLYSPSNIFQKKSVWSKIILLNSEIELICKNAKPDLKNAYPENDSGDNIEYLSFEYAIVSIVRPWFFEDFLNSDSFKLNELIDPVINDGNIPANGMIPCFINKFICLKKIEYQLKKSTTAPKALILPIISTQPLTEFKIRKLNQVDRSQLVKAIRLKTSNNQKTGASLEHHNIGSEFNKSTTGTLKIDTTKTGDIKTIDHRTKDKIVANNRKLFLWNMKHIATGVTPEKAQPAIVAPVDNKVADNHIVEEFEGIRIVAFECKRLRISPNPNKALDWN